MTGPVSGASGSLVGFSELSKVRRAQVITWDRDGMGDFLHTEGLFK